MPENVNKIYKAIQSLDNKTLKLNHNELQNNKQYSNTNQGINITNDITNTPLASDANGIGLIGCRPQKFKPAQEIENFGLNKGLINWLYNIHSDVAHQGVSQEEARYQFRLDQDIQRTNKENFDQKYSERKQNGQIIPIDSTISSSNQQQQLQEPKVQASFQQQQQNYPAVNYLQLSKLLQSTEQVVQQIQQTLESVNQLIQAQQQLDKSNQSFQKPRKQYHGQCITDSINQQKKQNSQSLNSNSQNSTQQLQQLQQLQQQLEKQLQDSSLNIQTDSQQKYKSNEKQEDQGINKVSGNLLNRDIIQKQFNQQQEIQDNLFNQQSSYQGNNDKIQQNKNIKIKPQLEHLQSKQQASNSQQIDDHKIQKYMQVPYIDQQIPYQQFPKPTKQPFSFELTSQPDKLQKSIELNFQQMKKERDKYLENLNSYNKQDFKIHQQKRLDQLHETLKGFQNQIQEKDFSDREKEQMQNNYSTLREHIFQENQLLQELNKKFQPKDNYFSFRAMQELPQFQLSEFSDMKLQNINFDTHQQQNTSIFDKHPQPQKPTVNDEILQNNINQINSQLKDVENTQNANYKNFTTITEKKSEIQTNKQIGSSNRLNISDNDIPIKGIFKDIKDCNQQDLPNLQQQDYLQIINNYIQEKSDRNKKNNANIQTSAFNKDSNIFFNGSKSQEEQEVERIIQQPLDQTCEQFSTIIDLQEIVPALNNQEILLKGTNSEQEDKSTQSLDQDTASKDFQQNNERFQKSKHQDRILNKQAQPSEYLQNKEHIQKQRSQWVQINKNQQSACIRVREEAENSSQQQLDKIKNTGNP